MRHFRPLFAQYKKEMILGPLVKLIETITELIIPMLVASMIDVGVANRDLNYIFTYGAIVIALNFVGIASAIICQKLAARAAIGVCGGIRLKLFKHINTFSYVELDKYTIASLNNRLTHDVARIQTAIGMFIRMVMRTPFLLLGSVIMAMIIDIKLSLIFLVVAPLVLGVVLIILRATVPLYDRSQKNLDNVSHITKENLQGVRVIRAFNKQEFEEERFKKATKMQEKASTKVATVSSLLNPFTGTIINFAIVAILWFGAIQVDVGGLTQGQIIAFINYLTQISMALVSLANIIIAFIKAINCGKRINEVLDTKSTIISPEKPEVEREPVVIEDNRVEYKNVSFAYGNATKYAVKNLSLVAKAGETIGIIGGTGSGKSSVAYLLTRFYDTTSGAVYVDGVDVREYDLNELRNKVGVVPQKAVLFSGSLRENMRFRKEDATDEEIYEALKLAQAEEFVSELEGGLDYRVQAGGKNFSGGQRQRLTIARALVGKPEILVLDDSASALDFATDAKLREALKTLARKMTIFIVSQRVNSIKNADQIIVLDGGEIVGQGKHEELLESCKVYSEIYASQTK